MISVPYCFVSLLLSFFLSIQGTSRESVSSRRAMRSDTPAGLATPPPHARGRGLGTSSACKPRPSDQPIGSWSFCFVGAAGREARRAHREGGCAAAEAVTAHARPLAQPPCRRRSPPADVAVVSPAAGGIFQSRSRSSACEARSKASIGPIGVALHGNPPEKLVLPAQGEPLLGQGARNIHSVP